MAGRIFINYRREDSRGDARSIYQRLERAFGSRNLFMDVDTIQKGLDFTKVLDEHLVRSDVMLAIIGKHWLSARDEGGSRRLDNPEDFVRLEIARALARDIAVIPVLVDGATMPSRGELPEDLKPLAHRQASIVTCVGACRGLLGRWLRGCAQGWLRAHRQLRGARHSRRRVEHGSRSGALDKPLLGLADRAWPYWCGVGVRIARSLAP